MPSRQAREVMVSPVITCRRSDKLREVAALFVRHTISGVPVVDREGRLCGIITKHDLLGLILPDYLELFADIDFIRDFSVLLSCNLDVLESDLLLAEDVMSYEPLKVKPETALMKCAALLHQHRADILCVVDPEGRLLGVLTTTDIARAFFGG
ncbi:MAG TPA: CBS domain-containing protein [Candidatus Coatesbacteria bacterium]|nr:CBS domain-containing protein [Candidatus Coatesbacteria bacterium]